MSRYQIQVEVTPTYLPQQSSPEEGLYVFAYTIQIRNTGTVASQLIARTWHINDAEGLHEKVRGLGVVGAQPLLKPGENFEYTSGTALATPVGTMRGSYFFVADDGERFETEIEPFLLEDGSRRVLH